MPQFRFGPGDPPFGESMDPQNHCAGCGDFCPPYARFCPWCGRENSRFDPEGFARADGQSIEEAMRRADCEHGHTAVVHEERRALAHLLDDKFCSLCGKPFAA